MAQPSAVERYRATHCGHHLGDMVNGRRYATCRACGGRIFWAKTLRGGSMPLDEDPVLGGDIELAGSMHEYDGVARVVARHPDVARYTSHWDTCPQARLFG